MRSFLLGLAALALLATPAAAQVFNQTLTAQTSVGTTATLVAAARPGRTRILVSVGSATACAVGAAGITLTTGFVLSPTAGATVTLVTNNDVYAVCSATTTISTLEETR